MIQLTKVLRTWFFYMIKIQTIYWNATKLLELFFILFLSHCIFVIELIFKSCILQVSQSNCSILSWSTFQLQFWSFIGILTLSYPNCPTSYSSPSDDLHIYFTTFFISYNTLLFKFFSPLQQLIMERMISLFRIANLGWKGWDIWLLTCWWWMHEFKILYFYSHWKKIC